MITINGNKIPEPLKEIYIPDAETKSIEELHEEIVNIIIARSRSKEYA